MESKGIHMILETKLNGVKRALEETFLLFERITSSDLLFYNSKNLKNI